MSGFVIKKAEKKRSRARVALSGPSGSGKTYSALRLAKGLANGGTVGVIDTERRSASLYADLFDFVTIEMDPPYTPDRYVQAIEALENHGCDVIVLDQMSHEWSGVGGVLERVDAMQAQGRNKMQAWATMTPLHQRFIDAILRSKAHVIATMRSKTEWHIDDSSRKPTKVGLAPVQRDGIEFEFTVFFEIGPNHVASTSKDRTRLFEGRLEMITESWGAELRSWLDHGAEPDPEKSPVRTWQPGMPVPPRIEGIDRPSEIQSSADSGFDPDAPELVTDAQAEHLRDAAKSRAKELGLSGRGAASGLAIKVLQEKFNVSGTQYVRAHDYEAAHEAILAAQP